VQHPTDQTDGTVTTPSEQHRRSRAHTVSGACEQLGNIGRSTIYGLIAEGRLEAIKLGSRTLITDASIAALLDSLPRVTAKYTSRSKDVAQ
jgi:excisionase family DNA binding protein